LTDTLNVSAYAASDDRFTTRLSVDTLKTIIHGPLSTIVKKNKTVTYRNTDSTGFETPELDSIYTFRIKAQYIYDNRSSRMHYRIIGIAPIAKIKKLAPGGKDSIITSKVLFWIPYPKIRTHLANKDIYNPKNQNGKIFWSELLESRYFDRQITKSSFNNIKDKDLFELYPKPKERLEAEAKIRQRIDDYDQDRWVY
jgi:hypothetical protein